MKHGRLGMTLVETAVSLVIVAMTVLAVSMLITSTIRANSRDARALEANQISERLLEEASASILDDTFTLSACPDVTTDLEVGGTTGTEFDTSLTIAPQSLNLNTGEYHENCAATDLYQLNVAVTWGDEEEVTLSSLVSSDPTFTEHPIIESFTLNHPEPPTDLNICVTDTPRDISIAWDVAAAATVTLALNDGTPINLDEHAGTREFTITETTRFTLTAANAGGAISTDRLTAFVDTVPTVNTFSLSPNPTVEGVPSTLTWSLTGAESLAIDDVTYPRLSGTRQAPPVPGQSYVLKATNGACTLEQDLAAPLEVLDLEIEELTAAANPVTAGTTTSLGWAYSDPISPTHHTVTLTNSRTSDQIDVTNVTYYEVTPQGPTTYTLTITGPTGAVLAQKDTLLDTRPPAIIDTFDVEPTSVCGANPITATWATQNAVNLTLHPLGVDVTGQESVTLPLEASSDVYLEATNELGSSVNSASVFARHAPEPTATFNTSDTRISEGGTATLTWSVANGETITLNGHPVDPDGVWTVAPGDTTTYTLLVTQEGCEDFTKSITIAVDPLEFTSLTVTPDEVTVGEGATLSWALNEAFDPSLHRFVIQPGNIDVGSVTSHTITTTQPGVTTFTIEAYDRISSHAITPEAGVPNTNDREVSRSSNTTLTVIEQPEIHAFTSDEAFVCGPSNVTVHWETRFATSAKINGVDITPADAGSGQINITNATPPLVLETYNRLGYRVDSDPLEIRYYEIPTATFTSSSAITAGDTATLRWNTQHATRITLDGEPVDAIGELAVAPLETTTYTLEFQNGTDCAPHQETVTVDVTPVTIESFTSDHTDITRGESTTLRWSTSSSFDPSLHTLTLEPLDENVTTQTSHAVSPVPPLERYTLLVHDRQEPPREIARSNELTVIVDEAPAITSFQTEPASVCGPSDVSLTWDTMYSTKVTLNSETVALSNPGRTEHIDRDRTFTLRAENRLGAADNVERDVAFEDYPVVNFAADKTNIVEGDEVTLTWDVTGADRVTLNEEAVPASGTRVLTPREAATYELVATKDNGTTPEEACVTPHTVEVTVDPVSIASFGTSSSVEITRGDTRTLPWELDGPFTPAVHTLTLDTLPSDGSDATSTDVTDLNVLDVRPEITTDYRLTLKGIQGQLLHTSNTRAIVVDPPVITRFTADPELVCGAGETLLAWETTGASSLHLNDEVFASVVGGNTRKNITSTTTFELTAKNHLGASITARRVVQHAPAPTATFTTSSDHISHGDSITLAWDAQDAKRVRLDGQSVAPSGTLLLSPDQTTTYELVVEGDGCAPLTRSLTVTVDPVTIENLQADPAAITTGDTTSLTWALSPTFDPTVHTLVLEPTGEELAALTHTVAPRESTTYRLHVRARGNPERILASSNAAAVTVQPHPIIDAFRMQPANTCGSNATVALSWATRNASVIRLDGDIVAPNGTASAYVQSNADTFTLDALNSLGASVTRTISSTHVELPTVTFEANTETLTRGQSATLTWSTGEADLVTLNGQDVPAVGTRTVTPNETTTYKLRATRQNSEVDCADTYLITINVEPISIDTFEATPASIPASTSSILTWSTTPGELAPTQYSLTLQPLGIDVTTLDEYEVTPEKATRYHLELRNTHGTLLAQSEHRTIAIDGQPALTQAVITPAQACSATDATLTWDSVNAAHVLIDGSEYPASGSLTHHLTTSRQYTITAVDALGNRGNTETAIVNITSPPETSFSASSTTITRGGSTRLTWDAGAATHVTLNGVDVTPEGERVVQPLETTTYRLVAENGDCVTTRAVTVTVKNTSISSFQSDKADLTRGEDATLSWNVTNYQDSLHTLTLQPSGTPLNAGTGSIAVEPTSTTHYSLVLTDQAGRTLATRALRTPIRVHEAPVISNFVAEPARVCGAQDITFRWGTEHASLVTLNGHEVTPTSAGVATRTITEASDFVLTATNPAGTSITSEPITILHEPATSATLTASHETLPAGDTATLNWNATGSRITLDGQDVPASGTLEVAPERTTTYTLTAYQDGCVSSTSTVTITVEPARVTSFTSDATNLKSGDAATLNWDLSPAFDPALHQLLLEPTSQDVTSVNSVAVTPETSTTYELVLLDRLEPQRELHRTRPGLTLILEGETAVTSFTSDPTALCEAGTVTFAWTTANASRITLAGQDVTPTARGSSTLDLTTGTSIDLVAFDASGTAAATRTLTVPMHARPTATLTSGSARIVRGQETTLSWNASDTGPVTLNGEIVPASGSRTIRPHATTTYTLHARNENDASCGTTKSVTVAVDDVAIESFTVDKTRIEAGESVTFTWELGGNVTPDQHQVILEGHDAVYPDEATFPTSLTLAPDGTRTYRLTIRDAYGRQLVRSSDITIHVHDKPTIEAFTATPASICGASETLLTWTTSHATSVLLDGVDVTAHAGQLTRRLEPGDTVTLTARNEYGSTSRDLTIGGTVRPTVDFHASPMRRVAGEEATITWSVQDAEQVRLNGELVEPTGTRTDRGGRTVAYTLEVTGGPDCAPITQERVIVTEPVSIEALTADENHITEGDTTTLRWATSASFNPNLHTLTLESLDPENPFEQDVTALHTFDLAPTETTSYQVRISNADGDTLALSTTATITVEGYPAITTFEADPIRTCGPQDVTFTWSTLNAARVTLNGDDVMPTRSGSHTLTNDATTDYVLAAINPLGVTVESDPIPTRHAELPVLTFEADKNTIVDGDAVTLEWSIQNAGRAILDGQIVETTGSLTIRPTQTTTYTLVADNPTNGAPCMSEQTVTITVEPVSISSFDATPEKVTIEDDYTLAWAFSSTFDPTLHAVYLDDDSTDLADESQVTRTAAETLTHTLTLARQHDGTTIDTATTLMTAYPAPVIDRFSSNPPALCTPEDAAITWETRHASRITFTANGGTPSPVPATGSTVVQPSSTSAYTLTATNLALTSITSDLTIPVSTRPVLTLTSADARIPQGGKTTLTWNVQHADAIRLNGTTVPASGSLDVNPLETTTYTIEADRVHCGTLSESVTVTVDPLDITGLTATPTDVTVGESSTLKWELNAVFDPALHSFTLTPGPIDAGGSQSAAVTPASAGVTTYTLTATDPYDRVLTTQDVDVRAVLAPIIDTFEADPARVCAYPGGPTSLSSSLQWGVRNAERLDINGTTVAPPADTAWGTHPISVSDSATFTLEAFNELGYTIASTPVTVEHITAIDPTFATSHARITAGDTATLSWNGNGASVTLDGEPVPASGSVQVAPLVTTTYTISTVTSDCEPVTRTVTVMVDPVSVTGFSIDRNNVTRGDSAQLAWTLASTFDPALHKLVLQPVGRDVTNVASTNVTPTANTTYRLGIQDRQAAPRVLARSSTLTLTVNEMPAISSFTAEPALVCGARDVTLTWATQHANSLVLNGVNLSPIENGATTRTVTTNTTYTLAATNPAGTTISEQRSVTFVPAIQATFTSDTTHISRGETIELTWNVANATSVTLDGQAVTNSGSRTLAPTSTTTYTLVASDPDCPTITREMTVQVDPVTIDAFTYYPSVAPDEFGSIPASTNVEFNWVLSDSFKPSVHKLEFQGEDYTSYPDASINHVNTETYRLRLYDRAEPANLLDEAAITVHTQPLASFARPRASVCEDTRFTYHWDIRYATWGEERIGDQITTLIDGTYTSWLRSPRDTSYQVAGTDPIDMRIAASNAVGSTAEDTNTVTVILKPTIDGLTADTLTPVAGVPYAITYATRNTEQVMLGSNAGYSEVVPASGSRTFTASDTAPIEYVLTATTGGCPVIDERLTIAPVAVDLTSFEASHTDITAGSSATLTWEHGTTFNNEHHRVEIASSGPGGTSDAGTATSRPITFPDIGSVDLRARIYARATDELLFESASLRVTAHAPPAISTFTADPTQVCSANPNTTLTWVTSASTSRSINHGIGSVPANGNQLAGVPEDITWTLTATNGAGDSVTKDTSVTLHDPPTITSLTSSTYRPVVGQPYTLSWTVSSDTTSVKLDGVELPAGTTQVQRTANSLGQIMHMLQVSNDACTGGSLTTFVDPITTPGTPGMPTAINGGDRRITLSWAAPSTNGNSSITGYRIQRQIDGGAWATLVNNTASSTTTYADTAVIAGSSYTYRIAAHNAAGISSNSAASNTVTAITKASAPGTPTIGTLENQRIPFTWSAPSSNGHSPITSYRIQRQTSSDGSTWSSWSTLVSNTGSTGRSYTNTGLTSGTYYRYRVAAITAAGIGAWSNTSASARAITTTAAPGTPTINNIGDQTIEIGWPAPGSTGYGTITGYRIQRQASSDNSTWSGWSAIVSNTSSTSRSHTNNNLVAGTYYRYRVAAINAAGVSSFSSASVGARAITTPGAPGQPNISAGNKSFGLTWSAPTSDGYSSITGYRIQMRWHDEGGAWSSWSNHVSNTSSTSRSYTTDNGRQPGRYYQFRVAAINAAGLGAFSAATNEARAITTPDAPGTPNASPDGDKRIRITWGAPSSDGFANITGYRIQRSADGASWSTIVSNTSSTTRSYTNTALTPGVSYRYRGAAINILGAGTFSNASNAVVAATTPGAPGMPTVDAIGDQSATISWAAPSSDGHSPITGYRIQRQASSGGSTWSSWGTLVSNTGSAGRSYTNTGLTAGTYYRYRVAAINAVGIGAYSPISADVVKAITVPGTPSSPGVSNSGERQQTLTWTPNWDDGGSPITHYVLQRQRSYNNSTWTGWTTIDNTVPLAGASGYTVNNLTAGYYYRYRFTTVNEAGASAFSGASYATRAITLPGAPGDVVITNTVHRGFDVEWEDPLSTGFGNISGTRLEYSVLSTFSGMTVNGMASYPNRVTDGNEAVTSSSGIYTSFGSGAGSSTGSENNYIELDLGSSQPIAGVATYFYGYDSRSYYYKVKVSNDRSNWTYIVGGPGSSDWVTSPYSGSVTTGDHFPTADDAPAGQTARYIRVYGNGNTINTGNHVYEIKVIQQGSWTTAISSTTANSYRHEGGRTPGRFYRYRVAAINQLGVGPYTYSNIKLARSTPDAPSSLSVSHRSGNGYFDIDWPGVSNTTTATNYGGHITGYQLEYRYHNGSWSTWRNVTSPTTATAYVHTNRTVGYTYQYRVAAINEMGAGSYRSSSTILAIGVPSAPSTPTLSNYSNKSLRLTWGSPSTSNGSSVTGYRIQYRYYTGSWSSWRTVDSNTGSTSGSYIDYSLSAPRGYQYRVAAINAAGVGSYSSASNSRYPYYYRNITQRWHWNGFWCNYTVGPAAQSVYATGGWRHFASWSTSGGCSMRISTDSLIYNTDLTPTPYCRVGSSDHDGWSKQQCSF